MYSQDQLDTLSVVVDVTASLSLAGCFFIILVYVLFRNLRVFAFTLVLHMTLGDAIRCIGFLLQHSSSGLCYAQGVLIQVGSLTSVLWNGVIANTLYRSVVWGERDIKKSEFKYTIGVYLTVIVLSVLPATTGNYGDAEGWCWIYAGNDSYLMGNVWRGVCFFFPLIFVTINNVFSYYTVIKKLKSDFQDTDQHEATSSIVHRLQFYPMIMIICYVCSAVKRIYNLTQPDINDFGFAVAAGITLGSIGLIDALVYGFTESVRISLAQTCCPKRLQSESISSESGVSIV